MDFSVIWSNGIANIFAFSAEYGIEGALRWLIIGAAILVCIAVPYFLGGLNFAIILSKAFYGGDIREHGSGNAGATNMLRTYGKKLAIFTLLLDMLKAAISTALGFIILGINGGYLAGLFCILGHMYPMMYKFKGGKGVACVVAVILVSNPPVFLIVLLLFLAIVAMTRYVSLASVMCMAMYPWLVYQVDTLFFPDNGGGIYVILTMIMAGFIIFKHRENIKRLYHHTESKISFSKKEKKTDEENEDEKN